MNTKATPASAPKKRPPATGFFSAPLSLFTTCYDVLHEPGTSTNYGVPTTTPIPIPM